MNYLTAIALWHDEAFSALYLRYSWGEMMHRVGLDVHPPLYYIILRLWSALAGSSVFSLRLFSTVFTLLTVCAGYLFVRAAFKNKRLALISALLLAINPFQFQYTLEARMYTLGTFLILLSSYFLIRALESESKTRALIYWLYYSITAALCLYTHYYLIFSVAAQGLYILLYFLKTRRLKILLRGAGAYLLAFILYIPWIKTFLEQIQRVQASYWIPPMDRWSVPGTVWKMLFGGQGTSHRSALLVSIGAVLVIGYFIKKVKNVHKWYVLFAVFIPFAAAVAISARTNLYLDRYFIFASLFFTILIAAALFEIPRLTWRLLLIIALIGSSLYATRYNWLELDANGRPGIKPAAALVNQNAKAGDKIYVGSSFIYFTFKYYNETGLRPRLISSEPLASIPHFSGTAILSDDDLILDYSNTPKNNTVWLLWTTGFGGNKPGIPKNWKQLEEKRYADTPGFKGEIIVNKYLIN